MSEGWKSRAIKLKSEGLTWKDIYDKVSKEYPGDYITFRRVRSLGETRHKEAEKSNKLDLFPNYEPTLINKDWTGSLTIKFAIVSDTHIGSRYTQITYLHDFYDLCQQRGIKDVYHAGDITDGENMRPGHSIDLYTHGADEHVKEVCRVYPKREGMKTYFIPGNHDFSTMKHCGYDMGNSIASSRPDMIYLGRDCADVALTSNCIMELRHPYDAGAYALSYKGQKMIESFESKNKPDILVIGNYHKMISFTYREVHCIYAACFQSQTPFFLNKGLSASVGGWIVEVKVNEYGVIEEISPTFIPYSNPIKDDWEEWSK